MSSILDSLKEIQGAGKAGKTPSAGDYVLHECAILHGDGDQYPFGNLVSNISVFENIQSSGITGHMDVVDHMNLLQAGPLNGGELLALKFGTAGADEAGLDEFMVDFTENPLYIHSIERAAFNTASIITYRVHFCSPELVKNKRVRLSQAFEGTIGDIVENIMLNNIGTTKEIYIEPTLGLKHYVAPMMQPLNFIRDIASSAQALEKKGVSWTPSVNSKSLSTEQVFKGFRNDYFFYENCDGYNFKPISTPEIDGLEFTFGLADTTTVEGGIKGYAGQMLRTKSHSISNTANQTNAISAGTWSGKHIRHNAVTKSYATYKSDYLKALVDKKHGHISETLTFEPNEAIKPLMASEYPEGRVRFSSSSSLSNTINHKNSGLMSNPTTDTPPGSALNRQMQLGHLLGYHRLHVVLYGISGLRVGMGAYAELPAVGLGAGQEGLTDSEELAENRFDNYWIITKVHHQINLREFEGQRAEYVCNVELANTMAMTEDALPTRARLAATWT